MSPYVLIILLNGFGFSVDFWTVEACQKMEARLNSSFVYKAACGPRGAPVPAFEVAKKPEQEAAVRRPMRQRFRHRPARVQRQIWGD